MSTDLVLEGATERATEPNSIMAVVSALAMRPDVDIDKLQRLLEMQERWDAKVAEKAFNVAFAKFKGEAVNVVKNIEYKDGPLKGRMYANSAAVVSATAPILAKYGLGATWKLTKDDPAWLEVTCTLKHELGHSESVSMGGAPDGGPARNAIQSRGSAKTYLERYTLLAITGLSTDEDDDDGNGGPKLPNDQREYHLKNINSALAGEKMNFAYQAALKAARECGDKEAEMLFAEAKNARLRGPNRG